MTIYRYDMTIPVRVVSALHSGGVDEVPERPITDEDGRTVQPNAFVRNGLGEAILPGRSIKGAIRAAFEEHMNELRFSKEELKSLWGGEMRQDVGTGKESLPLRASALTFHHTVVWDRNQGDLPHRMSTAIDRATGGAADGALFAYEYLPVDTTFKIRISAETQDQAPAKSGETESTKQSEEPKGTPPANPALVEKALDAVITLIHSKLISLGGRTGAGWGRIELGHDEVLRVQVAIPAPVAKTGKPTDPLDQLLNLPRPKPLEEAASSSSFLSASTSLEIEWKAPSGLFVGMNKPDGIKSPEEDTVPAAPLRNWHLNDTHRADHGDATYPKVAHEDKASLLLPGTSIRGALRSHCSRIARSIVSDGEGSDELTMAEDVHKQLAADPILVRYLFGTTEYRGAVRVHDCEGRIPAQEDKPLKLTRNAIDRVTGSAAHGALYSELLYPHATWDPIQIDVDHAQLCRNIRQDPGGFALPAPSSSDKDYELPGFKIRLRAAILLLTMAITDLCEGVLPLGGGTGGGLGFIDVSHVSFEGLPGKHKSVNRRCKEPPNSDDAHEVREARANFARNILTSILAAFAEDGEDATSAEQRVVNLIREWAELGHHDDQGGSVRSQFRPATVRIGWNSPTGVFVHDPQADYENTQHPLRAKTAGKNGEDSTDPLLLPGTSIRGALRSRCSRIARTVLYADNPPSQVESFTQADSDGNQVPIDVHEQLAKEPRLVRYMFGTTEYRGAVRVRDCTTKNTGPSIKVTHNAIDRWTGGVVEGLLFNEVIYPHATWNDIVIEVDTARLLQNVKTDSGIGGLSLDECLPFARASWCLLCIALAELSAGTLPLGGRTTRGHGQVEVTSLSVSGADGQVVNTPAEAILWKRNDTSEDDARGGATALLAYLRNKTEEQPSYEDWAERLLKLEEPTNGASKPNESNKQ